jgi:hypothetical protein
VIRAGAAFSKWEKLRPALSFARKDFAMAFKKSPAGANRKFGVKAQRIFLAQLAQTANVTASAKAAGVTTAPVYALRMKSDDFRTLWHRALSEGYARLEANLLAEALAPAASTMKDSTFKLRQMKIRLGASLFAAHRNTVRGTTPMTPMPLRSRDPKYVRQRLEARFAEMRTRLADGSSGDE